MPPYCLWKYNIQTALRNVQVFLYLKNKKIKNQQYFYIIHNTTIIFTSFCLMISFLCVNYFPVYLQIQLFHKIIIIIISFKNVI